MAKLIYDSPIFRPLLAISGKLFLMFGRWRVVGEIPDAPKFVAIAAPHTSNWDFPLFMSIVGHFNMRVQFLGKASLFEGPFGKIFYYLGGIPVKRNTEKASNLVREAIKAFAKSDKLVLGIAPEGTRSSVDKWKTGFYRIAVQAEVPILLAYVDSAKREIGLGPLFHPTGDMDADIAAIQAFYADKVGVIG